MDSPPKRPKTIKSVDTNKNKGEIDMQRSIRKSIKVNEREYEIVADYAESKGITLGEAIQDMKQDIDTLKANELLTIIENAIQLCDEFEALTDCSKLPETIKFSIKTVLRPLIIQGLVHHQDINFDTLLEVCRAPLSSWP